MLKKIIIIITALFALVGLAFTVVFFGMRYELLNVRGSIVERNKFFGAIPKTDTTSGCKEANGKTPDTCDWSETREWAVIHDGLIKDQSLIQEISLKTGVDSRMIISAVIPEQLRFFSDNREVFKRYFEPLKILGSLTQFSLGVSGIKEGTAIQIESYANNPKSTYYPGPGYSELLKYEMSVEHDKELFNRLTDAKNHYYSYLYTAIFIREIEKQWERAGYNVYGRPDVIVTVFNLGFGSSKPKVDPIVGGAHINLGGKIIATVLSLLLRLPSNLQVLLRPLPTPPLLQFLLVFQQLRFLHLK